MDILSLYMEWIYVPRWTKAEALPERRVSHGSVPLVIRAIILGGAAMHVIVQMIMIWNIHPWRGNRRPTRGGGTNRQFRPES